ncbi:MAG: transcription-repair coupling factor [Rhodothermales bacterium]
MRPSPLYSAPLPVSLLTLRSRVAAAPFFLQLRKEAAALAPGDRLRLKGTVGSLPAFALADLVEHGATPLCCLLAEPESAAYLQSDLEQLLGEDREVLLFPPSGQKPYDREQMAENAALIQRADALQRLEEGFNGIVVTSVTAVAELVAPPETVAQETLTVRVGDEVGPEALMERFIEQGFEAVEFVALPGELALRGGILDIYPFAGDYPVRIEFFGDEIDSIREFDPQTQRSVSRMTSARVVPNLGAAAYDDVAHVALLDYFPDSTLFALFDEARLDDRADTFHTEATEAFATLDDPDAPEPDRLYLAGDQLRERLARRPRLLFGTFSHDAERALSLEAQPQPDFNSDVRRLRTHLAELKERGFEAYILCDSQGQRARLRELLGDEDHEPDAVLTVESMHEGFVLPEERLAVYTDHQVFHRYHRPTARKRRRVKGGLSLRDIAGLTPGDFVVHVDYGIGKFAGLNKITVRDKKQEAVRVLFLGGDELFVNVNALHKLHKYTGKEGHQPKLTKLGSGQWERAKGRTKKRVKDIARDLVQIYAKRKASSGYGFAPDSVWQREMEASFRWEDTPDQALAASAVKEDMEQPIPMDRLVCGDVGFGKTEIAIRAAFKAVQDGKQVAVLVPTTILALQHFETFTERLARFPVKISQLSRFVPAAEQKEVLAGMKSGDVDIVIGTQRLAGKKVEFKRLGLLVIDEEQRFGVAVKERLRKMRSEVDTLTLTATPIPRTLQFSLLGVRDLSTINTPPPNRQPVVTEIHTFDRDLIRDAILYEFNRGGQVFFVHNRVRTIEEMAMMIRAIVPDVRVKVAHGQMKPTELENVMHDFIQHKFDVLVATSIVESGIDVANANTMIIDRADRFGLSDLHQLRGRVGRSDRKAFCYLMVPSVHTLTREARMRLQAVEEFSELGSGFNIAMRDLDIRGAGAMLGAEQSGFIEDLGYETYHRILEEAVQELRHEEFSDLFKGEAAPPAGESTVDVEEDALIPGHYVSNNTERMNLYRRLADLGEPDELAAFRQELGDRFGPIPPEVDTLLMAAEIKTAAQALRLPRVQFKNQRLFLDVPSQDADPYFYETAFHPLLERLAALDRRYVLKETKGGRLRAIVQDVPDLPTAKRLLEQLRPLEAIAA